VKKEASYHGVDLLEMFYGKNIYSSIHGVSDAAKCIFIIKCAADAYDVISARKSVNSSILPWSNDGDCNPIIKTCFTWLCRRGRVIENGDVGVFNKLIICFKGSEVLSYRVASRLRNYGLSDIIIQLVSGRISIKENGELS